MVTSIYENAMSMVQKFHDIIGLTSNHETNKLYNKGLRVEELMELLHGFKTDNRVEQFDGLADADFVNFMHFILVKDRAYFDKWHDINTNLAVIMDIPATKRVKALEIVCRSNLSKFDTTEREASRTHGAYMFIGVETYTTYNANEDLYVTRSIEDQYCINGKFYPEGKLVKSSDNYFEPDFTELL